tara:strand:+ start:151 stop:399 length:249 start_codon:yes stop_codon:yes gene_type:complete
VAIDLMWRQKMESYFQSQRDRARNADQPEQMRPRIKVGKDFKKALKGVARQLYIEKKVKYLKAETEAANRTSFKFKRGKNES